MFSSHFSEEFGKGQLFIVSGHRKNFGNLPELDAVHAGHGDDAVAKNLERTRKINTPINQSINGVLAQSIVFCYFFLLSTAELHGKQWRIVENADHFDGFCALFGGVEIEKEQISRGSAGDDYERPERWPVAAGEIITVNWCCFYDCIYLPKF